MWCPAFDKLGKFDHEALRSVGFDVPEQSPLCPALAHEARRSIHCCCEPGNLLSDRANAKFEVYDNTKEDDFTTEATMEWVKQTLQDPGDVLFYCSPCTGGSPWQAFNLAKHAGVGTGHFSQRMSDHLELHWKLWERFEVVARHCAKVGATVLIEWPRGCAYWRKPRVRALLSELHFKYTTFDGCMYGLRAKIHGKVGMPIRKPWTIAYLNSDIGRFLNKTCDHSQLHHPRSGKQQF